jgi:hypothetical protein
MLRRIVAFFPLLPLLACGAGASPDDAESTEADYTVTPTGGTGQLKVTVPAGAAGRVIAQRQEGGTPLELTSGSVKAVAPGKYCIHTRITSATNQYDIQFETQSDCSVVVAAGATVDYALGAVKIDRSRDELVYGLDVGGDTNYSNQSVRRMLKTTTAIAHAKGTFEYAYVSIRENSWSSSSTYRPLDSISFDIAGGATTNVDLLDTNGKWGLRVIPGDPRTLPNSTETSAQISARVQWSDYSIVDGWVDLGSLPKPLLVRAKASSNLHLEQPTKQELALTQPPSDKKLARLDVEHVQVSMPDGTTKQATGTVAIGGTTKFKTGTGIDLLPGTYELSISYTHPADGASIVTNVTAPLTP